MSTPTPETDAFYSGPCKRVDTIRQREFARKLERQCDALAAALRELSELPLPGAAEEIIEAALAEVKGG